MIEENRLWQCLWLTYWEFVALDLLEGNFVLNQIFWARRRILLRRNTIPNVCFLQILQRIDQCIQIGHIIVLLTFSGMPIQFHLFVQFRMIILHFSLSFFFSLFVRTLCVWPKIFNSFRTTCHSNEHEQIMSHPANYQLIIEKIRYANTSLGSYLISGREKFPESIFFSIYSLTSSTRFWQMWSNRYFFCDFILVFSFFGAAYGCVILSKCGTRFVHKWNRLEKEQFWATFQTFSKHSYYSKILSNASKTPVLQMRGKKRSIHSNAHNQQPVIVTQFTFNDSICIIVSSHHQFHFRK